MSFRGNAIRDNAPIHMEAPTIEIGRPVNTYANKVILPAEEYDEIRRNTPKGVALLKRYFGDAMTHDNFMHMRTGSDFFVADAEGNVNINNVHKFSSGLNMNYYGNKPVMSIAQFEALIRGHTENELKALLPRVFYRGTALEDKLLPSDDAVGRFIAAIRENPSSRIALVKEGSREVDVCENITYNIDSNIYMLLGQPIVSPQVAERTNRLISALHRSTTIEFTANGEARVKMREMATPDELALMQEYNNLRITKFGYVNPLNETNYIVHDKNNTVNIHDLSLNLRTGAVKYQNRVIVSTEDIGTIRDLIASKHPGNLAKFTRDKLGIELGNKEDAIA
jgi:hypothetical protein